MGLFVPYSDYRVVAADRLRCSERAGRMNSTANNDGGSCAAPASLDGCKEQQQPKTQFATREGAYKLLTLATYSRPNRIGYNTQTNASVRVSFVSYSDSNGNDDRVCFNIGRELYVYFYKGTKKGADLTKPIDKKIYKGINPTCHDFNSLSITEDASPLIVGFSTGLIQLIDPVRKDVSVLFNEEKIIDKTKVTCIKWVPNSKHLFLASHSSGQLYLYNESFTCGTTTPSYQQIKSGDGFTINTCKTKSTRNPVYRWLIGTDSINEFAFSPCGVYLAIVSQDGFLRVFHYEKMELVGMARSYFGGFLCVCWSPDTRYIVVGGQDDLVTVYSISEQRVIARGQGHHSWVSVVAFDPFLNKSSSSSIEPCLPGCYRLGSVGHDTQLCLWDITDDILHHVTLIPPATPKLNGVINHVKQNGNTNNVQKQTQDPMRLIGTASCPRFDQCPRLEPLVCKKIAHDRLTALIFRKDCFVAACQNGFVYTWARPGTITSLNAHLVSDPNSIMSLDQTSPNATSIG